MPIGHIAERRAELLSSVVALAIGAGGLIIVATLAASLLASGNVMLVWPAAGVSAGMMALATKKARVAIAIGLALGFGALALTSGLRIWPSIAFALTNIAEAWLFAFALDRIAARPPALNRAARVAMLVILSAAVPILTGLLAHSILQLSGPGSLGIGQTWQEWWRAHGLALLTITPIVLQFRPGSDARRSIGHRDVGGAATAGLLAAVIGGPIVPETSTLTLWALLLAVPVLWFLFRQVRAASAALVVASLSLAVTWAFASTDGILAGNAAVGTPVLACFAIAFLLAGALREEESRDPIAALHPSNAGEHRRAWFLLIPIMLFNAFAWWAWHGTMKEAHQRVEQVVGVLSTHTQRVLEAQAGIVSAVAASVQGRTPEAIAQDQRVHAFLRTLQQSNATCLAIAIIRTDTAKLVSTSSQFPAPDFDASHRDFISELRASPATIVVGDTIVAAASGKMGFTVSRSDIGNSLAVISLVDRAEFQRFYASQDDSKSDTMLLFREDGRILASYPEQQDPLQGRLPPAAPPIRFLKSTELSPVRARGEDGIERLYAVRKIPDHPLFVAYGLSTSFMQQAWLAQLVPFALLNVFAGLVLWHLAGRVAAATRTAEAARTEAKVERALRETVRASEARLRQSEEASTRLATIVTTSSDAIISKTLEGIVTSWNEGAQNIFGFTAEEIVGQSIRRLIPPNRQHEEDVILARLAAGQRIDHFETLRVRKDGKVIDVSVNISPIRGRDGIVTGASTIVRDVSERKAAEAALAESERRFRGIFDHAGTGIEIADFDGRIAQCNPAYAAMLGYAQDELVGQSGPDRIHPDDRPAHLAQLERLANGEIPSFEIVNRALRRDGTVVWLHMHVSTLLNHDGQATHQISLVIDMTAQRRAEERQHMLMRELAHRSKNVLAVIQSIANRSFSGQVTLAEARSSFQGRMQALARTYETLTDEALDGAELEPLVRGELDAFEQRARIGGPSVRLTSRSAQTLALVVHELATNAAKYGALSVARGKLDVEWRIGGERASPQFEFIWIERGGPPAVTPDRRGFGTALVSTVAGAEFHCKPELTFGPEGFSYRFSTELSAIGTRNEHLVTRERIRNRAMLALYDMWLTEKGANLQPPSFEQFDRDRIANTARLKCVEVSTSGECRVLEGCEGTPRVGADVSVRDELMRDEMALRAYRHCAHEQQASYEHTPISSANGKSAFLERLMVPYLRPGRQTTVVVVLTQLSDDEPAEATVSHNQAMSARDRGRATNHVDDVDG